MIAQTFAIEHPDKTLSLSLDHVDDRRPGRRPADTGGPAMLIDLAPQTREEAADARTSRPRSSAESGYPLDEERVRARPSRRSNRGHRPVGFDAPVRGDLRLRRPHAGAARRHRADARDPRRDDPLVTPSGGEATAKAIPGAGF